MKPETIEAESFTIIEQEAGEHGFSSDRWQIVRRMIHTSADFEYMRTVRFHTDAIASGIDALRSGRSIITDTHMARVGVRNRDVQHFGGSVVCLISDATVAHAAKDLGTTRALAAVDAAVPMLSGGIYVVGNAPTALMRLIELVRNGSAKPALIVGLPVGFVNAAESKADLLTLDCPYITNTGRKGGSNVAAAVVNALLIMARNGA